MLAGRRFKPCSLRECWYKARTQPAYRPLRADCGSARTQLALSLRQRQKVQGLLQQTEEIRNDGLLYKGSSGLKAIIDC